MALQWPAVRTVLFPGAAGTEGTAAASPAEPRQGRGASKGQAGRGKRDDKDPPARVPRMFMAPLLCIASGFVGISPHLQKEKRTQEDVRAGRAGCAAGEAAAGV